MRQDHFRERSLRLNQAEAERMLWTCLRSRRLQGLRFRRQHRIGPYIADFVCRNAGWWSNWKPASRGGEHDAARSRYLQGHGYRVIGSGTTT